MEGTEIRHAVWILAVVFATCGATSLFEDDFDDGNADGWFEFTTGIPDSTSYYVESGWYHMELSGVSGTVMSYNGDVEDSSPHTMSIPDYRLYCQVTAYPGAEHVGFGCRMLSPVESEQGYILWLRYDLPTDVVIWRHDEPSVWSELAQSDYSLAYGETYWICFRLDGGLLHAKVWQGELADEPAEWLLTAYDTTYYEPGSIGMGCHSFGTGMKHAAFDEVMVVDPTGALAPTTWGAIKSTFVY